MKPTIGRIVHWQSHRGVPRAAIVTEVWDNGEVMLTVFAPGGTEFEVHAKYSETPQALCWNWPPRSE